MAVKRNPDGTETVVHEGMQLGKQKHLVRASDFLAALQDTFDIKVRQIQHKQPRILIESFRVIGADVVTAQDAAFYELLLANAKASGIEQPQFTIPMRPVMDFLKVRHVDRVLASLERLTRTVVRYDISDADFRRRGSIPLVIAEVAEELSSSAATLTYSIPDAVRRTILSCSEYALIDLAPFAEFKGRYTPRLYQRLCIRATYDDRFVVPWTISPQELAEQLGYPNPDRVTEFMKRVVVAGLAEINQHSKRFTVTMDAPKRKESRGRAIKELSFLVRKKKSRDEEQQRVELTPQEVSAIRHRDPIHGPAELPSIRAVQAAAERTGIFATVLSNGWRALLDMAKANPAEILWGSTTGAALLDDIEWGADGAFGSWVDFLPSQDFVPRRCIGLDDDELRPERNERQMLWSPSLTAAARASELLDAEPAGVSDDDLAAWLHPYGDMFKAVRESVDEETYDRAWEGIINASKLRGNHLRSALTHFVDAVARADQQRVLGLASRFVDRKPKATGRAARLAGRA